MDLRDQAVLFRASHHSRPARGRARPGATSRSSSSAASSFSRPRTSRTSSPSCAGPRTRATTSPVFASLKLIPGIGPATARRAARGFRAGRPRFLDAGVASGLPRQPPQTMQGLAGVMRAAGQPSSVWEGQIERLRRMVRADSRPALRRSPPRAAATSISWSASPRSIRSRSSFLDRSHARSAGSATR